jgi:hypothetical protein
MPVKENHPRLLWAVQRVFADPALVAETGTSTRGCDKGHGRLEMRRRWASTALVGSSDWPGRAQALGLERAVVRLHTGEVRREVVSAVTSLPPEQADAPALLRLWRGHWGSANRLHWLREVSCNEDRSAARVDGVPQMLAACRTTVIGLLRAHGHATITATRRALARNPFAALAMIGL